MASVGYIRTGIGYEVKNFRESLCCFIIKLNGKACVLITNRTSQSTNEKEGIEVKI